MKKVILFLAMCLISTMSFSAITDSGNVTPTVMWTLDDEGTLTIKGMGEIPDYERGIKNNPPWDAFQNSITTIIIEDGITAIGNKSFSYYPAIDSVYIGKNVESIGDYAFSGLMAASIVIPDNVKSIGYEAFCESQGLTSVVIGNGVTDIAEKAFCACLNLTSLSIGSSVANIGERAFATYSGNLTTIYVYAPVPPVLADDMYRPVFDRNYLFYVPTGTKELYEEADGWKEFTIVEMLQTADSSVVINGVTWATRNVDAPGKFAEEPESFGMLYQWNRNIGWSSTEPLINSNGGTKWDDTRPAGDTWEKANDPSPAGYRVPTKEEIESLFDTTKVSYKWTVRNGVNGGVFTDKSSGASIFLPAVGYSIPIGGISWTGIDGNYWSSTKKDHDSAGNDNIFCLIFLDGTAQMTDYESRYGQSLRCVKDINVSDTTGISITPSTDNALITWEPIENAEGYLLKIYADEAHTDLIRILKFDAEGRFVDFIPIRSGSTGSNFTYTIENLLSGTTYYYALEALDTNGTAFMTQTGGFTTQGDPTGAVETGCAPSLPGVTGYYSITGVKLPKEPASGVYIIKYDDGTAEKKIKMKN